MNQQYKNICMGCMRSTDGSKICPHCGYDNATTQNYPYLPTRTVLADRYVVGKLLSHTSDYAMYMAFDINQKARITVREFLPRGLSTRIAGNNEIVVSPGKSREYQECMQNYIELWRSLGKMRELSAIIPVYDIIEQWGTVFAVSEYMDYISLRDYLLRTPEGYISWDKARTLFMPVLSTLIALHNNGIIHRSISPNTLVVCKDGKLRLTNFSVWQANTQAGCLQFQDQPGYFAIEQYKSDFQQGPWTDIYGFTATLYRALIGNNPIDSLTRSINDKLMIPGKFAEQIPAYVINAMGNALQIFPNDRTRNVEQLRAQLSAAPSEVMSGVDTSSPERQIAPEPEVVAPVRQYTSQKAPAKKKPNIALIVIAAILVLAGVGAGVYFGIIKGNAKPPEPVVSVDQIAVPNFVDYTENEVKSTSNWTNNFKIEFTYEFSDTVAKGIIFGQSAPSGSTIDKGAVITLTVSKGIETITLADYTGVPVADAKAKLEEQGFTVQYFYKDNDGTHTYDTVYSQSLEANKSYQKGTKVVLQVWDQVTTTQSTTESTSSATKEPDSSSATKKPVEENQ